MRPTVLFFDMDSTLVLNRFSRRAIQSLLAEIAPVAQLEVAELARKMGRENEARQLRDPDNLLTMDWGDIIRNIAHEYGVTLSADLDERWREYANAEEVEVLDQAHRVLAELKQANRHLVIATKGLSKYQDPVLAVTGLRPYFDDVLTPDSTGFLKTSPNFFQRYYGKDALFIQVGDHYYDDVICAKRNGFWAIQREPIPELASYTAFERPAHLAPYFDRLTKREGDPLGVLPDALILSLEELPTVIATLEVRANE